MTATTVAPPPSTLGAADHPQRLELNDEVHARPPEALSTPARITFVALYTTWQEREVQHRHLAELIRRYGGEPPAPQANHHSADLGPLRVKWERHTEFTRYQFIAVGCDPREPFAEPAISLLPRDWVAGLPGEVLVATNVALLRAPPDGLDVGDIAGRLFAGNTLIGSDIGGGNGTALTDLRIHPDRFGRLLLLDRRMTRRQAGRMVQRLLEIDAYRILALLALPVARELAPALAAHEQELAQITAALADAGEPDEPVLLERLTRLEAAISKRAAETHYRFSAANAYYELVQRRITELREQRIEGMQTFGEFMQRRLAPAMHTCQALAARQEALSTRAARVTQLLSTRVDITRERQNQAVLESMNRRAKLQLRLQETVEGLSVAAVTYYVVGLVGYAAKSLKAAHLPVEPDITTGIAIPLVAVLVALGVRRTRRWIARREADH
jgi:uncharacterized membrane-anchored protein